MSQEANFSYTLKTPKAGNLFTIRGDSAEEAKVNLDAAVKSGLLAKIREIEDGLILAGQGNPPAGQEPTAPATAPPSNPAPQGSLNPACPTCGGATVEKSGNGSRGPWRGYFCQNSTRDNKHEVVWA